MDDYVSALEQYGTFSGRTRRREFWMFTLINSIFLLLASTIDALLFPGVLRISENFGPVSSLYALTTIIPAWALAVRRMHDVGWNGWWVLISVVPLLGVLPLILTLTDGNIGPNRWGENPKRVDWPSFRG